MTLQEIIAALTGPYKGTYSVQAINAVAETLATTGMVTQENLQTIVDGASGSLKSFQQEMDRRVAALQTENTQLKSAAEKEAKPGTTQKQAEGAVTKTETAPAPDEVPAWAKPLLGYVEKLQTTEKQQSLSKTLSEKLKAAKLPETVYKSLIDQQKFDTDEQVEAFVETLKGIEQARTNAGLSGMSGNPQAGTSGASDKVDLSAEEKAFLDKQKPKN